MDGPSFDPIAPWYDQTRSLDPPTAARALQALARRYPPARYPRALELGVGTGRIAFPMAAAGYRVVGVDRSGPMLERLRLRQARNPEPRLEVVRGNVTRLPLPDGVVDLVYWVHVLHLVPGWRRALDEAIRVTRPGGLLLDVRAGSGRDIRPLAREYDRLRRRRGLRRRTAGVRRRATILRHLRRRGVRLVWSSPRWSWTESVRVDEALEHLGRRIYSSMRSVPAREHRAIMAAVRRWAVEQFGALDRSVDVQGGIELRVLRTPARRRSRTGRGPAPVSPLRTPRPSRAVQVPRRRRPRSSRSRRRA